MSERVIRDCDGCGRVGVTTLPIHIPVAWYHPDFMSARLEEQIKITDLCETCSNRAITYLANTVGLTVEQGAKLHTEMRTWKAKFPDSGRP